MDLKKAAALAFLLVLLSIAYMADTATFPNAIRAIYRFPNGDRVGHVVLYGILAWLMARAFPSRVRVGIFSPAITSLLVAAMALVEEISQFWFPTRTPDLVDLSCGLLGIIVADWLTRKG